MKLTTQLNYMNALNTINNKRAAPPDGLEPWFLGAASGPLASVGVLSLSLYLCIYLSIYLSLYINT